MQSNIRKRLFLFIALSMTFVIGLCMVILLFQFRNILVGQAVDDQKGILLKGAADLNTITNELDRITLYLCGDQRIPQLLENSYENDEVEAIHFSENLRSAVATYTNYPIIGSSLDYFTTLFVSDQFPSAEYLQSSRLGRANDFTTTVSNSSAAENEDWYRKTVEYNTKIYCFLMDGADNFIFFSKLVKSTGFKKPFHDNVLGVLVLAIKKPDIQKILNSAKATESTEILLTYEDMVLTETNPDATLSAQAIPERFRSLIPLKKDNTLHQINYGDVKYSAMVSNLNWNLKMMTMIPERDITKQLDQVIRTMLIELLAIVLIAFLISTLVSNVFTKPIVYLTKTMQQVRSEDNLVEIPQKHSRNDEISYLYVSYNSLIRRIHQLMNDIKTTMTLQKKSELKALQAQINPHFIYNSLDTVNWMALCEGQQDISIIATSLVDIFRYGIKDPDTMVTLEEEIYHLAKYLQIQDMRYAGKFTFDMDIPDTFLKYSLPKLTIQPLVENSLFHAISSQNVISIRLSVENTASRLSILVSDTGKLADPESINEYLQGGNNLQSTGEGIGIRNLNKRIKMYFGDDFGLHYERTEDGLVAVLTLPPSDAKQ